MDRVILHSDLNNFYASVECLYRPELSGKPVAVCGNPETRHGIVLAKNQIAKGFGIKTGETIWMAKRKCPELVLVPPNFDRYLKYSKLAKDIYCEYTDRTESFGIDEAWLDVGGSANLFGDGISIADTIRERIRSELGVTVSVGVSFNKIFAKLASDMKKPDATTVITRENYREKVWPLMVCDMLYVGPATTAKLRRMMIFTIEDLAKANEGYLQRNLGKSGPMLHRFANGQDTDSVKANGDEGIIKSVGNSTTTPKDLKTAEEVRAVFQKLADTVATRLRRHGLKCTAVQISMRDNSLISCERQAKLDRPSFVSGELLQKAMEIFLSKYRFSAPLRSVGLRAIALVPEDEPVQLSLFDPPMLGENGENVERAMDDLRRRFGRSIIKRGGESTELFNQPVCVLPSSR